MIVKNEQMQYLGCNICGECVELTRKVMGDPETVLLMKEHMTEDHKTCLPYANQPLSERALLNRSFHVRLQAEMRGIDGAQNEAAAERRKGIARAA